MNSFLVLPACKKGTGGGHLYRSIALVKELRSKGGSAWLFADSKCDSPNVSKLMRYSSIAVPPEKLFPEDLLIGKEKIVHTKWTLIILDRFCTEHDELKHWTALGPVVGIDEGLSRKNCDFLIDLLPNQFYGKTGKKANFCDPSLLPLPKKRRPSFTAHNGTAEYPKILVSFGAEDTAGLTVNTALALQNHFIKTENSDGKGCSITVVLGPLRKNNGTDKKTLEEKGITVIQGMLPPEENPKQTGAIFDLQENLARYDLLITHFGITAFQALYARVPALLINPSAYHEQLSRHAGFLFLTLRAFASLREGFAELYRISIEKSEKAALRWGLEDEKQITLSTLLLDSKPVVHRHCPLCGSPLDKTAGRFPGRTYRYCSCGIITMDRLTPPKTKYNRDYFFTEYQNQYGKTYLDDFSALQRAGEKRLNLITALRKNSLLIPHAKTQIMPTAAAMRLLDIGCAYGPFLAAAKKNGFDATGIDPAPDAVGYVKKTLGINAVLGSFPESLPLLGEANEKGKNPQQLFDVITLWYVLEHFEDPGKVLRAINRLLAMGGILAFSTPSSAGISRRKSLHLFLENSPDDHWTIWDPRRTAAILKRYGFRLKKRKITGHHPERFFARPAAARSAAVLRFCFALSRIFGLGDTFEAYAVKERELQARQAPGGE